MATPSGHTEAIAASKVCGSDVFNVEGKKIGKVEDVVLAKMSDQIKFAIVGFGGFLGIGEKYHAVPWKSLDYRKSEGGYVVPYSKEQLQAAPYYEKADLIKNDGAEGIAAARALM